MKCPTYHIFFKNLANPLKVNIISLLKYKEMNVNELVKELKEEQSKVSHALSALNHCNIVVSRQSGKNKIYSLNKTTIVPMLKLIDKHKCKYCPGR
ncbi:putative HTH-type transcriptional regulator/MT0088 [archaeon BMS3Abin17]|nr:putative HTH-type transcriptional regulator/MT0088 [archaeon BMS3Abin17]HDZ60069.1 ArsR family transcriptional regulator [Candidatus Pacearchaeota archaeon]